MRYGSTNNTPLRRFPWHLVSICLVQGIVLGGVVVVVVLVVDEDDDVVVVDDDDEMMMMVVMMTMISIMSSHFQKPPHVAHHHTAGDSATSGTGFNELAAYTIGSQNATNTKLEMTTPVFTKPASAPDTPPVMQFVIEESMASNGVPAPNNPAKVQSAVVAPRRVAVRAFGGWPLEWEVAEQVRLLRGALLLDGLHAKDGYELARYNDPFTPPWLRRNEVLIELDEGWGEGV